jgi:hypothetical protein
MPRFHVSGGGEATSAAEVVDSSVFTPSLSRTRRSSSSTASGDTECRWHHVSHASMKTSRAALISSLDASPVAPHSAGSKRRRLAGISGFSGISGGNLCAERRQPSGRNHARTAPRKRPFALSAAPRATATPLLIRFDIRTGMPDAASGRRSHLCTLVRRTAQITAQRFARPLAGSPCRAYMVLTPPTRAYDAGPNRALKSGTGLWPSLARSPEATGGRSETHHCALPFMHP